MWRMNEAVQQHCVACVGYAYSVATGVCTASARGLSLSHSVCLSQSTRTAMCYGTEG